MAIRQANRLHSRDYGEAYRRYRRKADQEWEMAGLAQRDGDFAASAQHTEKAIEYETLANSVKE